MELRGQLQIPDAADAAVADQNADLSDTNAIAQSESDPSSVATAVNSVGCPRENLYNAVHELMGVTTEFRHIRPAVALVMQTPEYQNYPDGSKFASAKHAVRHIRQDRWHSHVEDETVRKLDTLAACVNIVHLREKNGMCAL